MESSTTYAGLEGATSDGEIPQSFDEDTISQEGKRILNFHSSEKLSLCLMKYFKNKANFELLGHFIIEHSSIPLISGEF